MSNDNGQVKASQSEVELVTPSNELVSSAGKPVPPPTPPTIQTSVEVNTFKALANFDLGNATGTLGVQFDIPKGGLQQISLGFQQNGTGATAFWNFSSQSFGETFTHTFSNNLIASATFSVGSTETKAVASLDFHF